MDTTEGRDPSAPPLLVRWADPVNRQDVVTLLRDVPLAAGEVADLVGLHGVLVLSDVTLPHRYLRSRRRPSASTARTG